MERTSTVELQRADFSAEFELLAVWTSIIEAFRFVKKFSSTEKATSAAFAVIPFVLFQICVSFRNITNGFLHVSPDNPEIPHNLPVYLHKFRQNFLYTKDPQYPVLIRQKSETYKASLPGHSSASC